MRGWMGMIDGEIQHLSVDLVRESFTHQHLALARHLIWYHRPPHPHPLPGAKKCSELCGVDPCRFFHLRPWPTVPFGTPHQTRCHVADNSSGTEARDGAGRIKVAP
jgi:hypothetical protein